MNLNRLMTYKAGSIKSDNSDIAPNWTIDATRWTLDAVGNHTAVDYFNSYGSNAFSWLNWYQNTANAANEYTSRKSQTAQKGELWDLFSADTHLNWTCRGSGDSFTISTTAHTLTVGTVSQDTIDGVTEPAAQALILTGEKIGPTLPAISFTVPTGTTTGQIGLVFGYKSGADYWLWARDMAGTANIYHVVSGSKNLISTLSYPAPTPGVASSSGMLNGWGYSYNVPSCNFGSSGFPSGRIGLYTTIPNAVFSSFQSVDQADVHVAGRWWNPGVFSVDATQSKLSLPAGLGTVYNPILLENLRLQKFQATLALTRNSALSSALLGFAFNATDRNSCNYVWISHGSTVTNSIGWSITPTAGAAAVSGTNPASVPTCAATDTLWCRVQNDGTTVTVKCINSSTAPSESTWSSTTACYSSTAFPSTGGMLGFVVQGGIAYVDELTIKSWNISTSAFDITEHYDNFTVDGSGYASETPTYDLAGNLTYDGVQQYTYDAWNRLITIAHAYRDSSGTLQHGQTFDAMRYDAKGRRLSKAVSNTGQWDCTYNYYYDHDRMIEERNGSNQVMKQHVWGLTYIDELIQVAANSNPTTGNACSNLFWASQDANFNVLGLVNSSGSLVERYEYTPYGQRKVLFAAGNSYSGNTSSYDPTCYAIAYASPRFTSNMPCFGLCEIGHQGLMHDEESELVCDRARHLQTTLARFLQRDPAKHRNGDNLYQTEGSNPIERMDPTGEDFIALGVKPIDGFLLALYSNLPWTAGTGGGYRHLSLEYWSGNCSPPIGFFSTITTLGQWGPAKETATIQLFPQDWIQPVNTLYNDTISVLVSAIVFQKSDEATTFSVIGTGSNGSLTQQWNTVVRNAQRYPYAEQDTTSATGNYTVARNWPDSKYEVSTSGNNSNTFARYLVRSSGLTFPATMSNIGQAVGSLTPHPIDTSHWSESWYIAPVRPGTSPAGNGSS